MFTDVLGALLGFSVVMLLFSLVVTALVQATQSLFRMRNRSLQRGLADLLGADERVPTAGEARVAATAVLTSAAGPSRRSTALKEIESDQLVEILKGAHRIAVARDIADENGVSSGGVAPDKDEVKRNFERIEVESSDRFTLWVRRLTIGWAFILAATYQLSAPELFNRLLEDPEFRERAVAAADRAIAGVEVVFATPAEPAEDIRFEALSAVADKHPGLVPALATREEKLQFLAELELAYEGDPDDSREEVLLEAFDQEESTLHAEAMQDALGRASTTSAQLSALGFGVGARGTDFYRHPGNWLGVLMSTVLLSLGAPFWYQQVSTLKSLQGIFRQAKGGAK